MLIFATLQNHLEFINNINNKTILLLHVNNTQVGIIILLGNV